MWINDKVKYTPEIVKVEKGKAVTATVEAVGVNGRTLGLRLSNGELRTVDADLCSKIED